MHVVGESDKVIVPKKQPNKGGYTLEEVVEGRVLTEGNSHQSAASWTQSHASASNGLMAVRKAAQRSKGEKFTALLHHVTTDLLRQSYYSLKRDSAPGMDGVTWESYGTNLEERLGVLHERIHRGAYRARPARRVYIQKADGSQRPLSVLCVEDKIVQQAIVSVLSAIYEPDFLGFSYGFRPGRGQHDALDALHAGLYRRKVNWVFDADIQSFFDTVDHEWMMRFLKHRIGDRRILRLITKWLRIGTVEGDCRKQSNRGVPQGAVISPILANIYLHYVFDLWSNRWRKNAVGDVIIIRYADDTLVGFQSEVEATRFYQELQERMCQFGLNLHPDKTRVIRFGRYASEQCRKEGLRKPETFDFLGFTHYCTKARKNGWFVVGRKTIKKRMRKQLQVIKQELRKRLHAPLPETGRWLNTVLRGHLNYFAVPGNGRSLNYFFNRVTWYWLRELRRRSQRSRMNWVRYKKIMEKYFPAIRILHPQPIHRFDARTRGRSPVR